MSRSDNSRSVICRICTELTPPKVASNLFVCRAVDGLSLAEVVALVGNIMVRADEHGFPAWCCFQCQLDVEMAYRVRVLCQESDRKLREMLEETVDPAKQQSSLECKMEIEEPVLGSVEPITEHQKSDKSLEKEDDLIEELILSGEEQKDENDKVIKNDETEDDLVEELKPSEGEQKVEDEHEDDKFVKNNNETDDDLIEELKPSRVEQNDEDKKSDKSDETEDDLVEELGPSGGKKKYDENKIEQQHSDAYEEVPCEQIRCCGCRQFFDTRQEMLDHAKLEHAVDNPPKGNKKTKLCDVCFKLIRKKYYSQHQSSPKTMFRCKECGELFKTAKKAISHNQTHHYVSYRTCCACDISFDTVEALREHSNQVHLPNKPPADKNRPFMCNVCYTSYKSNGHLYQHRVSKGFKRFQCSQCKLVFRGPLQLTRHEASHKDTDAFRCPICQKISASYDSLRLHIVTHKVRTDRYKCDVCKKGYRSRIGLVQHKVANHGAQGRWQCQSCPTSFTKEILLMKHRKRFHMAEVRKARTRRTKKNMDQEESNEASNLKDTLCFEGNE